jgi:hypothetical protein
MLHRAHILSVGTSHICQYITCEGLTSCSSMGEHMLATFASLIFVPNLFFYLLLLLCHFVSLVSLSVHEIVAT